MGALTTHVLDTANGVPAADMKIELWVDDGGEKKLIKTAFTNKDGRLDGPALSGEDFKTGRYELLFYVADYFASKGGDDGLAFLNVVPICFGVVDCDSHYHVPLLVSPFSYSTYRGS